MPDFAPLGGGAEINLQGNNFKPWDYSDIDNSNDTFCDFGPLGKKKAIVKSSTWARCTSPPNNFNPPLVKVELTLSLNGGQNKSQGLDFIFFNPPGLSEVAPLRGPVTGGTDVHVYGTKFNHARDPVCIFGGITVTAKFLGPSHLLCVSPPFYKAGET